MSRFWTIFAGNQYLCTYSNAHVFTAHEDVLVRLICYLELCFSLGILFSYFCQNVYIHFDIRPKQCLVEMEIHDFRLLAETN